MPTRDITDQVNGQYGGERLDHQRASDAAGPQFGIHGQHRGAEFRHVQAIERWHHDPGWIEFERLGRDPLDQTHSFSLGTSPCKEKPELK
jgi:hypothetical protein